MGEGVSFGGITFQRYRGGLGFGVPTDKAYFYPEGVEGLFGICHAPADTFETVNTVGLPLYARMISGRAGPRRAGRRPATPRDARAARRRGFLFFYSGGRQAILDQTLRNEVNGGHRMRKKSA